MNYKFKMIYAGLGLILALLVPGIQAATWQLGMLAESSQSPFIGDARESSPIPLVNYLGDRFSFIDGNIEYKLSSGEGYENYIIGHMRARQFYSASLDNDDPEFDGMRDRQAAFELGAGLKLRTARGEFGLEGLIDAAGVHDGFQLTAEYSYPKKAGRWLIEPTIGLQLQSRNLVDYYHGVMESEAQPDRSPYSGSQSINTVTSLTVGYAIDAHMLAIISMEQLVLDNAIADSPIISEKQVRKVYLGLIYTF